MKTASAGSILAMLSSAARHLKPAEGSAQEDALHKADEIKHQLGRQYSIKPYLTGSLALGLNLPGKYDYDYGVNVRSLDKYHKLLNKFEKSEVFKPSPYNKPNTGMNIFQGEVAGVPVDLALLYGDPGKQRREATARIKSELQADNETRLDLLRRKAAIKDLLPHVPFIGEKLVKRMKKKLDEEIGMPRFGRYQLSDESPKVAYVLTDKQLQRLGRSNVFGHRTDNLEPLIQTGKLLSAAQAAKKGLLKTVELPGDNRGQRVEVGTLKVPMKFRSEVFMTKGILPSDAGYGQYGVLFEKQKATPSPYINTVPNEHTHEGNWRSRLTYVVPDTEYAGWQERHPESPIIQESRIPKDKILSETAGFLEIAGRVLMGPRLTQKRELVKLNESKIASSQKCLSKPTESKKIARARWQEEGAFGAAEMSRPQLQAKRNEMWMPSAQGGLNPEQLARHQQLAAKQTKTLMRQSGGVEHPELGVLQSYAQPGVDPKAHLGTGGSRNPVFDRAVVEHELAETAHMKPGALSGRGLDWAPKARGEADQIHQGGGHAGVTPNIAQASVLSQEPTVAAFNSNLRGTSDAKNQAIEAKMRQFGHRPDSPMPLWGQQHQRMMEWGIHQNPTVRQDFKVSPEQINTEAHLRNAPKEFNRARQVNIREGAAKMLGDVHSNRLVAVASGPSFSPIGRTLSTHMPGTSIGERVMSGLGRLGGLLKRAEAAKPTGFYQGKPTEVDSVKFKTNFQGIPIHVDRPKGFIMQGVDKQGKEWARQYKCDYGFIPRTMGGDKEELDVFIGPDPKAPEAYWCTQSKDDGSFDEFKVILGVHSKAEAVKLYGEHIPKNKLRGVVSMRVEMLKAMLGKEPKEKLDETTKVAMLDELLWLAAHQF